MFWRWHFVFCQLKSKEGSYHCFALPRSSDLPLALPHPELPLWTDLVSGLTLRGVSCCWQLGGSQAAGEEEKQILRRQSRSIERDGYLLPPQLAAIGNGSPLASMVLLVCFSFLQSLPGEQGACGIRDTAWLVISLIIPLSPLPFLRPWLSHSSSQRSCRMF